MEQQENPQSRIESENAEFERRRGEIEAFFADVALRLAIETPRCRSTADRALMDSLARSVRKTVQTLENFDKRLDKTSVFNFQQSEGDARQQLAHFGRFVTGYLFLYRHRVSRNKAQLIEQASPAWIEKLGEILSRSAELYLANQMMNAASDELQRERFSVLVLELQSTLDALQDDPHREEGGGRGRIDWTRTMLENNDVHGALMSIVGNRCHTALRLLLDREGYQVGSLRGHKRKDEFGVDDWTALGRDLGLLDVTPFKTLLQSTQGDRLLKLADQKTTHIDAEKRRREFAETVESLLGPRAEIDPELCISVFRNIRKRLKKLNDAWTTFRREEEARSGIEPGRDLAAARVKSVDEPDEDEMSAGVPDLLHPGKAIRSPGEQQRPGPEIDIDGSWSETDHLGVRHAIDTESAVGTNLEGDEAENWIEQFPYQPLWGAGAEALNVDAALSAIQSLSFVAQILVCIRAAELACVPVEGGREWVEKEIVFAAALNAMHRVHAEGADPDNEGDSLCQLLASLGDRPATKGFAVFSLDGDRGPSLKNLFLSLARAEASANIASEIAPFELWDEGRGYVTLSPRDRRRLKLLFEQVKMECIASSSESIDLGKLFSRTDGLDKRRKPNG